MTYKIFPGGVFRGDGVVIPEDNNNPDWQEYQAWLAAGGVPDQPEDLTRRNEIVAELAALDSVISREGEEYLAALEELGAAGGVWTQRKTARDRKVALRSELAGL